jgi:hypothetical protein
MNPVELNWVAIVVAAFVVYVLGAVWYSPVLFARPWMRVAGMSEADVQSGSVIALVVQAVVTMITSAVLAVVVSWSGADNPLEGAAVGLLLGAGLVAIDHTKLLAFERRPPALFAINNGYTVLGFIIMASIVAIWR